MTVATISKSPTTTLQNVQVSIDFSSPKHNSENNNLLQDNKARLYNSSCYLYGWKANLTTLSGNLSLSHVIRDALEACESEDGPDIRVVPYRSLTNVIPDMTLGGQAARGKKREGENALPDSTRSAK
jgi:hypothetical protein